MALNESVVPLPKPSPQARSMVRKQITKSLFYSFWQILRFPLFLFSRQGFRNRIRKLVQGNRESHSA
jgi:hypothetical protein